MLDRAILPLNDRVLVKLLPVPSKRGELYIPEIARDDKAKEGKVVLRGRVQAKGPGRWVEGVNGGNVRRPVELRIGSVVQFRNWKDFFDESAGLLLIQEDDVLVVEK
jgi:co-chaperonin GroES (HSP10)